MMVRKNQLLVLCRKLLIGFLKFVDKHLMSNEVSRDQIGYYIPNLGENDDITMHCIIRPGTWPESHKSFTDKDGNTRTVGVVPHCVGVMRVEVDELGLRFRWQPAQSTDKTFTSPFVYPPSGYGSQAEPDKRDANAKNK